jgi:hypothetical protein
MMQHISFWKVPALSNLNIRWIHWISYSAILWPCEMESQNLSQAADSSWRFQLFVFR